MSRDLDEIERDINRTREQLDEILDALKHKLSPSELIEEAMAYYRKYPGEAGRYVTHTMRDHPISLTMAGIGLGLLAYAGARAMSGGGRHRQPDHPAYPRYGLNEDATTFGQPVGGPAHNEAFGHPEDFNTGGDLYPDVRSGSYGSGRRRDGGRHYADTMAHEGHRRYEQARHAWEQGYHSAQAGAREGYDAAREGMRQGYRQARHATGDALRYAKRQARQAGSTANEFVRDEPLLIGAAGLAIGAVLGAVLPMTRRENRAIGRESDTFRERVKDAAREGYHRAEHVAEASYDAGKGEAKQQGFSSEGVKSAAENIEKKTAAVYSAATETAKKEAQREASSMGSSPSSSSPSSSSSSSPSSSSPSSSSSSSPSSSPSSSSSSSTPGTSTGNGSAKST